MRKYVIYISLLFISLAACQEDAIPGYAIDRDGLQFNYDTNGMLLEYRFMEQFRSDTTWGGKEPTVTSYYFGDSLLRDTIFVRVSLMGHSAPEDREFRLKSVPLEDQDPTTLARVEFFPSYLFHAGNLEDSVQIVILRPEKRGDFRVGVTFDLDENDPMFEWGAKEKKVCTIKVIDRYPKPADWDMNAGYLGEYSEEKYAFMVTFFHDLYRPYGDWSEKSKLLRQALEEYNAANPGNEKDFTFPAKPRWWDWVIPFLGEYSDAKGDFILSIVGENNYNNDRFDWSSVNAELRKAYDDHNAAYPNDQLPFEQFPVNTKPDWWDWIAAPYLGEFSDAKQEFVKKIIGKDNYKDQFDWSSVNAELREAYDDHNAANPDDQLPFEQFPVNTRPRWWDWYTNELGDWSEVKKEFLIGVVGEDGFNENTSWWDPGVKESIKTAYDAYNEANPDNKYPFTFPWMESGGDDKPDKPDKSDK